MKKYFICTITERGICRIGAAFTKAAALRKLARARQNLSCRVGILELLL